MIYQYAAEEQHQTVIVYFLIEMASSAKFLAYIYIRTYIYALNNFINEEVLCIIGHIERTLLIISS